MWDLKHRRSRLRSRCARQVVDEEILEQSQVARVPALTCTGTCSANVYAKTKSLPIWSDHLPLPKAGDARLLLRAATVLAASN